jgi:hypothetical protein
MDAPHLFQEATQIIAKYFNLPSASSISIYSVHPNDRQVEITDSAWGGAWDLFPAHHPWVKIKVQS